MPKIRHSVAEQNTPRCEFVRRLTGAGDPPGADTLASVNSEAVPSVPGPVPASAAPGERPQSDPGASGRGSLSLPVGSGVGSLPGTDAAAALRLVFNELAERPGMPFLAELPERGVGADMIGRTTALLVDMYAEVQPSGWRIVDRPGRDHGRALSHLSRDLDLLEEHAQEYSGPLKIQAAGPWTLAAAVELPHGDKMLADPGAVRDLAGSLAEGLAAHLTDVRKRVPGAEVLLQLDEPALPGVLRGTVPTASGFGRLRAVDEQVARDTLRQVIEAVGARVIVHCCAPNVPFSMLRAAGAAGISFDLALVPTRTDDDLGEAIEAGTFLFAGVVPSTDPVGAQPTVKSLLDQVLELRRLGFPADQLARSLAVTPACGLAGASPAWAARALRLCAQTAGALQEAE
jgi:hypothetical protein